MKLPSLSLPTRLSLAATAALVVTTVVADVLAVRELRANLSASVSASLSGMISRVAGQMDEDLADLRGLLADEARLAEGLPPEEVRKLLAGQGEALHFAFDYGVLLVDASGAVLADSRKREIWEGVNLAGYEFFLRTFATRLPVVSQPFAAPTPDRPPVVMLTVPLRDRSGRMTAMLAGGVDLMRNRVMTRTTGVRASRFGQIGVFTADGQVVAHTDKSLILEFFENPLPPGQESGGPHQVREVTAADGEKALLAVERLAGADWIVAGVFPSEEIYAPIETGFAAAHVWFAAGLAVGCALVWLLSGRMVRNLGLLAREVEHIGEAGGLYGRERVRADYRDEAGMLAGAVNGLLESLDRAGRDIDELSSRLAGVEERERRVIAADLHDSVCQTLALANMRLGSLRKKSADPAESRALGEVQSLLEQSVGDLKTLTFNLSPGILYELGLVPALEWHAGEFAKKYGLPVEVRNPAPVEGLGEELAIFLYRAAGELLTNAAKHAGAHRVELTIRREGDEAILEVADDGRGMPSEALGGNGFGLRNLRDRIRHFRGQLEIAAREGGGTAVRLRVPVASE